MSFRVWETKEADGRSTFKTESWEGPVHVSLGECHLVEAAKPAKPGVKSRVHVWVVLKSGKDQTGVFHKEISSESGSPLFYPLQGEVFILENMCFQVLHKINARYGSVTTAILFCRPVFNEQLTGTYAKM